MKENTIVAASDLGYVWGVWLLIASMRMNGMDEPILIGTYKWTNAWIKDVEKFSGVSTLVLPPEDKRNLTCSKPYMMTCPSTEYITWADCDGMFYGNCSDLLLDDESHIYIRSRTPREVEGIYTKERLPSDVLTEVPQRVLDRWQTDVGERKEPRRKFGCSAALISIHRSQIPFVERWRAQMERVLPSNVGVVTKGSIAYFQTDESVLNSLLLFAEDAPAITTRYRMDNPNTPHFIHFGYNPKPWSMWNPRSIGWFDKTIDAVEWACQNGYQPEAPLPYTFKRKNRTLCRLIAPLASNVHRLKKMKRKYLH